MPEKRVGQHPLDIRLQAEKNIDSASISLLNFCDSHLKNCDEYRTITVVFPELSYENLVRLMIDAYEKKGRKLIFHVKSMIDMVGKYGLQQMLSDEELKQLYLSIIYHDSAKLLEENCSNVVLRHLLDKKHGHSLAIQRLFLYLGLSSLSQVVRHNDVDFCVDWGKSRVTPAQMILNFLDRADSSGNHVSLLERSLSIKQKMEGVAGFNSHAASQAYEIISRFYELVKTNVELAMEMVANCSANSKEPHLMTVVGRMDGKYHPPIGKYMDTSSAVHIARSMLAMNWRTSILHGGDFTATSFDNHSIEILPTSKEELMEKYSSLCCDQDVILVEGFTSIIPPLIEAREKSGESVLIPVIFRGFSGGRLKDERLKNALKADEIWGVSHNLTKAILDQADQGSSIVRVIPNGVDHSVFKMDEIKERKKGKIVYVGALRDEKGVGLLVDAFKILRNTSDDVELHLIGSGEMYGTKTGKIEGEGLFLHGQLSHESVAEHLQTAHVCVLLSSPDLFETFGKAVEEAKACGCPIIVSNSGGLPERVSSSDVGEVVYDLSKQNVAEVLRRWTDGDPKNIGRSDSLIYDWKISAIEIITAYYEYLRKIYKSIS